MVEINNNYKDIEQVESVGDPKEILQLITVFFKSIMKDKTKTILLIVFFLLSLYLNIFSSTLIKKVYQKEKNMAIWDLFHINFSFDYPYTIKIAEFIVIVNIVIFLFILLKYQRDLKSFKKYIFILSLFYLLRALLLPLTINPVLNSESFLKSFDSFKYGLFPSGHTGLMFLLILFQKNKKIKIFNIVSLIFVIILILIGKQHYTIDIIGAIFISYSLNVFYERNIENHDS